MKWGFTGAAITAAPLFSLFTRHYIGIYVKKEDFIMKIKGLVMKPVKAVAWQIRKVELFYAVAALAILDLVESVRVVMDLTYYIRR